MSNYMLIYSGGNMAATDYERKQVNDEWIEWFKKLDKAVIDQGNPFSPKAKSISIDGRISDDPDCSMLTGYSIIQAMSLDQAVQLARSCPGLRHGSRISVYETFAAM